MDYLQKIRSTVAAQVHSVAAQVNLALPGNPIFREYAVGAQIASAGPGLCWKIYAATKNSTKQEVAVWLFEKKQTENWLKVQREEWPEMLKRGVSQLTRFRHPRILTVERALEESRDCCAFCTEPVFASLANCFGDLDNIGPTTTAPPAHLKNFELHDVEIRHGLYQITEALAFLHNDAKTMHGNISPASVIINSKGAWKLAGFDFCIAANTTTMPGKVIYPVPAWSQNSISALCPGLDFVAPELAAAAASDGAAKKCDCGADIFSLGMLAFAAFNKGKPLFASQNSFACYRKNFENLKNSISSLLACVPGEILEDLKACLHESSDHRPNAIQFMKIAYFEHPLVRTLCTLDTRSAMDNAQKMQFFKELPTVLAQFPPRTQLQKVYPHLAAEFLTPMLVPFILPSVFAIAEQTSAKEFAATIMPSLVMVFPLQTPYQIQLMLLQKVKLFLEKMTTDAIKQHLLPFIYTALSNDSPKIQVLCLSEVPNVVKYVDREQMRTQLLPKLLRMVLESAEVTIRVQAMLCLAKLLSHLETWMVADQLLPALAKVNSKDPGVLMAVLGIYKLVFENEKFGINKEQCAKSVLPYLISTCVEPALNVTQFNQFMDLTHKLLHKVESEQRHCLEQLGGSRQVEYSHISDFANSLNAQQTATDATDGNDNGNDDGTAQVDLGDLAFMLGGSSATKARTTTTGKSTDEAVVATANLTLDEKKRMGAQRKEQQSNQQQRCMSPPVSPSSKSNNSTRPTTAGSDDGLVDSLFASAMSMPQTNQPKPQQQQQQQNQLDFLAEFLDPPSSNAKSNFGAGTAFPAIPVPTSSTNPIQRRTMGTASANGGADPFAQMLLMDFKKSGPQHQQQQKVVEDLLGDLLR